MIDCPIHELPWPAIHADLRKFAGEEVRRVRVRRGVEDDAAQEACAKIMTIGVANLPPELLGKDRGGWLRLVLRNVLRAMARDEDRWRHANGPVGAANCAGPSEGLPEHPTFYEGVDLAWLPPLEWRVITFFRLDVTVEEIAGLEGIDACEVRRRVKWAALRLRVPNGRRTLHLGLESGSLAHLRGAQRRAMADMLLQHGWRMGDLAADFASRADSIRTTMARRADRTESHEL